MFLENIKWDLTKQCFLNCYFCINAEDRKSEKFQDLDTESVKKIIDKFELQKIKHIQFLGGEPTYRKDFSEIIEYIDKNTNIAVGINTNGVLLDEKMNNFLCGLDCVKNICISIDGIGETHNKIRSANIFDIIINNISDLRKKINNSKKNITISVNTVICKKNYKELGELIKKLDALGVDEWVGLELINKQDNEYIAEFESHELDYILKELAEISRDVDLKVIPKISYPLIVDYANKKYNGRMELPKHLCSAGFKFAYIDWKGYLSPCDRCNESASLEDKFNLLSNDLVDAPSSKLFKKYNYIYSNDSKIDFKECSKKCSYYKTICYPCKAIAPNGDEISPRFCHMLFNQELNRIKETAETKQWEDCYFKLFKHITYSVENSNYIIYDHKKTKVYEIYDIDIKAIFANFENKNNILEKDLFISYLETLSKECSFILKTFDEIYGIFKSNLNKLVEANIIYESEVF